MLSFSDVVRWQGLNEVDIFDYDDKEEKVGTLREFPSCGWVLYLDMNTTLAETEQIVAKMKELEKERA